MTATMPVKITTIMNSTEFKQTLPKQLKNSVTSEVMHNINAILSDPVTREHFRENLLGYTSVLQSGRFKLQSYVDAVKYVSFKLLGHTNQEAYQKVFPGRVSLLITEGADTKKISSYVSAYNKNKIVNAIWEQTLVPTYVLNADKFQKAINVQVELMANARSELVRSNAANSLLHHLKPPEATKIELDLGIKQDSTIEDLRETTRKLAERQQKMIEDKTMSAESIAHSKIVSKAEDAEYSN